MLGGNYFGGFYLAESYPLAAKILLKVFNTTTRFFSRNREKFLNGIRTTQ